MQSFIDSLLSSVSDILFYPVILALFGILAWVIYCAGELLAEAWQRSQGQRVWCDRYLNALTQTAKTALNDNADIELEKIIQSAQKDGTRRLDKTRYGIRSGPTLGLMGTLIPMAEALLGLSKGDLPALASNSSTAFSTTVLGLAVGLVAYTLSVIRDKWVQTDVQTITFRAEELLRQTTTSPKTYA